MATRKLKLTRRELSHERRKQERLREINAEPDELRRLWKAIAWLVAEAVRAGRVADLHDAVLYLVGRVRQNLALPDAFQPATPQIGLPSEGSPQQHRKDRVA